ncbi:MAG TPA: hypothetical protein VMF51_19515 [Nocardioides sp.]|uniref:hypothetical protein n=1 Tax=Nocardioides sp. TaxID=35761 RepID=UPI002C268AF0|nr:hypothetical protein [Nocardioides sp.]HTW17325.1 hypothetical protein [Nocardioides sp.]
MTEDRAEQAFRDAFAQHADDLVTPGLSAVRRRRRWPVVAAAVAVLALVGGVGIVAALREDPVTRPANEPAPAPEKADVLPAAPDGWRWATWRDLAVQVPASWRDGGEPKGDWCADRPSLPVSHAGPYVSRGNSTVTLAIGCGPEEEPAPEVFGPAPLRLMQPHLTLTEAGEMPDGDTSHRGWVASLHTVGGVQLRLYLDDTDPASARIARRVHASTRTFSTDDHGCDVTSPVQAEAPVRPAEAFDVATVARVDSISVCQYDRLRGLDAPALMGSRRVEGSEADALLAAIQAAPLGGGPDRRSCPEDAYGDDALAVRLHHDGTTDDLHMYYDSCRDNGYDDGTSRRELTAGNCSALFDGPVVALVYMSELHRRCGRR